MSQFATTAELRSYLDTQQNTGRFSDTNLTFLLQSASDFLERRTGRIITASGSNTQRMFTTGGRAVIPIPDLRVASTVTLEGTSLDGTDGNGELIPSKQQPTNATSPTIYTGISVRPYRTGSGGRPWLSHPDWFDRNLDSPLFPGNWGYGRTSLPNDLSITGLWGWFEPPVEWKMATLALAGYYLQHKNALFTGITLTAEGGGILDYTNYPPEVRDLIASWAIGEELVLAG